MENPFAALFQGLPGVPSQPDATPVTKPKDIIASKGNPAITDLIESVFLITLKTPLKLSKDKPYMVYLSDFASGLGDQDWFDITTLEQALFERLVLSDFSKNVAVRNPIESEVVDYLFQSYLRLQQQKIEGFDEEKEKIRELIGRNALITLTQPECFENQNPTGQLAELIIEHQENPLLKSFLEVLLSYFDSEESKTTVFSSVFDIWTKKLRHASLLIPNLRLLSAVQFVASVPALAELFIKHNTPSSDAQGHEFQRTILGSFLALTCLPSSNQGPFDFFDKPSSQPASVHTAIEGRVWTALANVQDGLHRTIYTLLKVSPLVKHLTLDWIGQALHANSGRGKMSYQMPGIVKAIFVSDGFMFNLSNVLLRLAEPAVADNNLPKIDPTYCAYPTTGSEADRENGIHLPGIDKETGLCPAENRPHSARFTFLTEVFFMTHRSLDLSFRVGHDRLVQLSQDLNKLQRVYQDMHNQGAHRSEVMQSIQDRMDHGMALFLAMKATMTQPQYLERMAKFHVASSRWLSMVGVGLESSEFKDFVLRETVGEKLPCVPEFLLSNVADFLLFCRRFHPFTLESVGERINDWMTLVLTFMGSSDRVKNPHLRARLAESMESLMPHEDEQKSSMLASTYYRQKLFVDHIYAHKMVPTLLNVFVSIEMTGQGVAFEQKFNYRRPMYIVMEYLWNSEKHRKQFRILSREAEERMEDVHPPLFLRFINLLINDAIYLLDEGLSYMSKIREEQLQRGEGEWASVPAAQRQQREGTFQHVGMLARFHNVMGRETIKMLDVLTSEIQSIFVHPTLVDRIASMLNYFLLHLVGPKKRNFKVKDLKEYEFKPAEVVTHICRMYQHLGAHDNFCLAVSQDGRSYNPELFLQAEDVLSRIGQGGLISDLRAVAEKVKLAEAKSKEDEELVAEAPSEFLDPILSGLMLDPVILPTSKVVVDRSTIARHLLSDQSDPFNRNPLTMDQVIPDEELRSKVRQWLDEKRKEKAQSK